VFFRKSSSGGAGFGCTLNLSDSVEDEYGIDLAIVKGGNYTSVLEIYKIICFDFYLQPSLIFIV
jgi:hypothetical protein